MAEKRIRLVGTIAICAIATVSLLTLGWFNIRYFENTVVSQTEQHLTIIAESAGHRYLIKALTCKAKRLQMIRIALCMGYI